MMQKTTAQQKDFETLFRQHKDKIYRLALHITHSDADALDVLQNSFVKIMGNIGSFRKRSKLSTWIYRIAYNEALMVLRKKNRQPTMADAAFLEEKKTLPAFFINWPTVPDQEVLGQEQKNHFERAVRSLPLAYRLPFFLHVREGLSLKETASVLALKENTVKTRLHRGLLMVQRAVRAYSRSGEPAEEKQNAACGTVLGFMYDFINGKLGDKKTAAFRRHMGECGPCKEFLKEYAQALRVVSALECSDVPLVLQEQIQSFLKGSRH